MITVLVLATGCGGSPGVSADVVARVDRYELGVERLAELLAANKRIRLRPEVARAVTGLWVDYTIFADQLLQGDSLTDSLRVVAAMWPEIQQELADRYHAQLVADRVRLDSARIDSAYAAGDLRLIQHVLVRVEPSAAPAVRAAARRRAEQMVTRLRAGRLAWAAAVQASDDVDSRSRDGSVGVIGRGEKVVAFETAAFALGPGDMTGVVETSFGYHVLRRPPLADVRAEFVEGVESRLEEAFDDAFLAEMPTRWDVRVRDNIGPTVRALTRDPMRAKASNELLGTYRGGRLRMSDLARWIQAAPVEVQRQLDNASDSVITRIVATAMRDRALVQEARDAGVRITPESHQAMADALRRSLSDLAALLGFSGDSLAVLRGMTDADRDAVVITRIVDYLAAVAARQKPMQAVPPFLADAIRDEARWAISEPGVERALARAREIRGGVDEAGS
jgi:hypothetical protein